MNANCEEWDKESVGTVSPTASWRRTPESIMARRRPRTTLQTAHGINVTPLMDLTFLLLIVFMITAPMLEYEIDVDPPKMQADEIDQENSVMINLNADGKIIFQKETMSVTDLTNRLTYLQSRRPNTAVLIRADGGRPYREVIGLMKTVRNANIENISLVTQPEDSP